MPWIQTVLKIGLSSAGNKTNKRQQKQNGSSPASLFSINGMQARAAHVHGPGDKSSWKRISSGKATNENNNEKRWRSQQGEVKKTRWNILNPIQPSKGTLTTAPQLPGSSAATWIIERGVLQYVVQGYFMFPAVRFERQPTYVAPNEERHL